MMTVCLTFQTIRPLHHNLTVLVSRKCLHFSGHISRKPTHIGAQKQVWHQRFFSENPSKHEVGKDWLLFVKRVGYGKLIGTLVALGVSYIPLSYAYIAYVGYEDSRALMNCLEKGPNPSLEDGLIDRPELNEDLQRMISPCAVGGASNYYLITGERGIGKTTAVLQACKKMGGGVIYVDAPSRVFNFSEAFAKATGYKPRVSGFLPWWNKEIFREKAVVINEPWNQGNWYPVYQKFTETAALYKAKYHKLPVLVIDNVNILTKQNREILESLQQEAKSAIDKQLFITVFVASDGVAPKQLKSDSFFPRGFEYRIGDINQVQVNQYLQNQGVTNVDGTLYSRLYKLVGGRLHMLRTVSKQLNSGKSFEDVKKWLFSVVTSRIGTGEFGPQEKVICQAVVDCLKAKPECSCQDIVEYLKSGSTINEIEIPAVIAKLVSKNILAAVENHWVFYSNVERAYFEENPKFM